MKKLLLLISFVGCITIAKAQNFWQKISGGFNLTMGVPSGQFSEVNNNVAFGGLGYVMYNPSRSIPLYAGLGLGYQVMGSDRKYFVDYNSFYNDQYEVTASSNIFSIFLNLRLQSVKQTLFRPFAEGIIGWNDFFSTVNVERITYYNPNYNTSYGNSSEASWALAYGGAGGVDIRLNQQGNQWIQVKVAYTAGRNATYYTDPRILNNGQVTFEGKESKTNMLTPQLGFKLGL